MGARMIVRLSGIGASGIASELGGEINEQVSLVRLRFRGLSVRAWVYLFRSPHSYTGEDVAEFHIPGNPLLAEMLLDELIAARGEVGGGGGVYGAGVF